MRYKCNKYFKWRSVSGVIISGECGQILSIKHPRDGAMLLKSGYLSELKESPEVKLNSDPKENKMLDANKNENKAEANIDDSGVDSKSDKKSKKESKSDSKRKTSQKK